MSGLPRFERGRGTPPFRTLPPCPPLSPTGIRPCTAKLLMLFHLQIVPETISEGLKSKSNSWKHAPDTLEALTAFIATCRTNRKLFPTGLTIYRCRHIYVTIYSATFGEFFPLLAMPLSHVVVHMPILSLSFLDNPYNPSF